MLFQQSSNVALPFDGHLPFSEVPVLWNVRAEDMQPEQVRPATETSRHADLLLTVTRLLHCTIPASLRARQTYSPACDMSKSRSRRRATPLRKDVKTSSSSMPTSMPLRIHVSSGSGSPVTSHWSSSSSPGVGKILLVQLVCYKCFALTLRTL